MISVLTITHNRDHHLNNLVRGLEFSEFKNFELVVVRFNELNRNPSLKSDHFSIKEIFLQDKNKLPLAKARNLAARSATFEKLVFLDVDCIPGPKLLKGYLNFLIEHPYSLAMGQVKYLKQQLKTSFKGDYSFLSDNSKFNDLRLNKLNSKWSYEDNYDLFWSLSFALTKESYQKIAGFDENFIGYGAEDTDFSYSAKKNGIKLYWVDQTLCFHQYHASYDPPLNHFEDIIKNAKTFFKKWNRVPMLAWLNKFANLGLIDLKLIDDKNSTSLELIILQKPTEKMIQSCIKET
jgi:GT2 family glycosyltransferase